MSDKETAGNAPENSKSKLNDALGTWMPIETAPKCGKRFLASAVGWGTAWEVYYKQGKYGKGFSRTMFDDTGTKILCPTHWMPLPPPPEST